MRTSLLIVIVFHVVSLILFVAFTETSIIGYLYGRPEFPVYRYGVPIRVEDRIITLLPTASVVYVALTGLVYSLYMAIVTRTPRITGLITTIIGLTTYFVILTHQRVWLSPLYVFEAYLSLIPAIVVTIEYRGKPYTPPPHLLLLILTIITFLFPVAVGVGTSMYPTMKSGDIAISTILYEPRIGDIAVSPKYHTIHRVVRITPDGGYIMMGDDNSLPDTRVYRVLFPVILVLPAYFFPLFGAVYPILTTVVVYRVMEKLPVGERLRRGVITAMEIIILLIVLVIVLLRGVFYGA